MTTIRLKSLLEVQTTDEQMRAHCAAFQLTLVSWEKSAHTVSVTVQEDVSMESQASIAAAMTAQLVATLITVNPETP